MEHIKKYLKNIEPRDYQKEIYETCKEKSCLVVLPTGIGKTLIALMLTIERMTKFPEQKVLFLAPTRPLAEQHLNYYKKHLPELFAQLELFTGKTDAEKRKELWQSADIILSTPQCIGNDVKNGLYDLSNVSLLIIDEAHRAVKNYSYTYVAEKYKEQAKNPLVLGLTASPGSEKAKIKQIVEKLGIEAVEIRTRESEDVKEYLQELKFEIIKLDFPKEFSEIRELLKSIYDKKIDELKRRKLLFMPPTKKFLLECQGKIMRAISTGNRNFNLLLGASACAQAVKLSHALELLETQTLSSLLSYFQDLFQQAEQKKSKAVQHLVKTPEFNQAYVKLQELLAKNIEHPKLKELEKVIKEELKLNPRMKAIIFAQFRDTLLTINKNLNKIPGINARMFVGQAKKENRKGEQTGLSQKEQREIISEFSRGKINVLCASQIGEEGLDIIEVSNVIFYEPIPSEIRMIQRCLPADSKILMADGEYKEIKEISEGEQVMSYNEKTIELEPKKVLGVFENGIQEIIEVKTEKGNKIHLTKNHPILTPNGWRDAGNLEKSDYIALGHSTNTKPQYLSLKDLLPEETYICSSKMLKETITKNKITYIELCQKLAATGHKVNKKTLWGYANRDAIPIDLFLKILDIFHISKEEAEISKIKSRKGKAIDIDKITLSEFMWLLGIIASDGDLRIQSKIRENRKRHYFTYRFRVCNSNKKIIAKVKKIFKKINLNVCEYEDKIESTNTIIGKILNNFGLPVKGRKSKTLEMSSQLFQSNNNSLEGFLAGLFDGDGNYNRGPCQIRLGTASKKFAFQLQSLLLRLGINSKVCQFDKTETRIIKGKIAKFTGDFFSVEIYKKRDVAKFLKMKEIVKADSKDIHTKYSKDSHIEKNIFWVKIKEINKIYPQKTFNIEVKDNNTFIAENFMVHNSGRTARLMPGKLTILMTKKTRDEAYYWSAFNKEKKMKKAIQDIQDEFDEKAIQEDKNEDKQEKLF